MGVPCVGMDGWMERTEGVDRVCASASAPSLYMLSFALLCVGLRRSLGHPERIVKARDVCSLGSALA
jgi:hypothetical protein